MANTIPFPYVWQAKAQELFRERLVAMEITNTDIDTSYNYGKRIYKSYASTPVGQAYTTDPATLIPRENFVLTDEYLEINKTHSIREYLDDLDVKKSQVNLEAEIGDGIMYTLKETVDKDVLASYVTVFGANDQYIFDEGDYNGGVPTGVPISLAPASTPKLLSQMMRKLHQNKAYGDEYIIVCDPATMQSINEYATTAGFNTADAAIRNGYVGSYQGFKFFTTNLITAAGDGKKHIYAGRRGMIDFISTLNPTMEVQRVNGKTGNDYIGTVEWGVKAFTQRRTQFLDVHIA